MVDVLGAATRQGPTDLRLSLGTEGPTPCTHGPHCPSSSLSLSLGPGGNGMTCSEAMLFLEKALPCFPPGSAHRQMEPSTSALGPPEQQLHQQCQCLLEHFGASSPLSQPTIAAPNIQTRKQKALGSARLSAKDLVPSQAVWPEEHSSASPGPSILVCNTVK